MTETLIATPEFERNIHREIEQKFIPVFPDQLSIYRETAQPIEQVYLSHPSEPFSLRLREKLDEQGMLTYSATLKDRGLVGPNGLDRIEFETQISPELYAYYFSPELPVLRKLRANVNKNVSIDFFDNGEICVESEHPIAWQSFVDSHGNDFLDVSGDLQANNEWRAHLSFRRENRGKEALAPQKELSADDIIRNIINSYDRCNQVTIHLGGRSGSGKSTIVKQIMSGLHEHGLDANVISTDDYHRGTTWLETLNGGEAWTDWDDPVVYDTKSMAADLDKLNRGLSIPRRHFDFSIAEPVFSGMITPKPITIIEGIYSHSPDITRSEPLKYEMKAGLATCIGRRLMRDMRERPEFSDPTKSLRYMLEYAEPRYRQQEL